MEGFLRPPVTVLAENALVPDKNLISPAPNHFTHEVIRKQPYYYDAFLPAKPPEGYFEQGVKVVLLVHDGGPFCRVADARGLYVEVEIVGLRKL